MNWHICLTIIHGAISNLRNEGKFSGLTVIRYEGDSLYTDFTDVDMWIAFAYPMVLDKSIHSECAKSEHMHKLYELTHWNDISATLAFCGDWQVLKALSFLEANYGID